MQNAVEYLLHNIMLCNTTIIHIYHVILKKYKSEK